MQHPVFPGLQRAGCPVDFTGTGPRAHGPNPFLFPLHPPLPPASPSLSPLLILLSLLICMYIRFQFDEFKIAKSKIPAGLV